MLGGQKELSSIPGRTGRHRARSRAGLEPRHASRRSAPAAVRPSVATLLAVDAEYRGRAAKGGLRRIAPRRFNPSARAWLPIFHTERDGWQLSALYSNSARAHELGRTRDWVLIFFARDGEDGQCTVVKETRGPLLGRRVVRGRETECRRHYNSIAKETRAPNEAEKKENGAPHQGQHL